MKRERHIKLILLICVLLCAAFFVACKGMVNTNIEPSHTHTYSETWSNDNEYHWHEPTCEHETAIKDKAEHTFKNNICTLCGFSDSKISYTLNKDGYTVSGIGIEDSNAIAVSSTYKGKPVTAIGANAFIGCVWIKSIELPNTIKSIGEDAFGGCSSLQSITIPSSVESIGRRAFNGCSNLVKIELPFIGMGNGNDEFTDFFGYIFGAKSYLFNKDYVPASL